MPIGKYCHRSDGHLRAAGDGHDDWHAYPLASKLIPYYHVRPYRPSPSNLTGKDCVVASQTAHANQALVRPALISDVL